MAASARMTATERKELRGLVDERFKLLSTKLNATEKHIRNSIETRLEDEMSDKITAAESAVSALMDEAVEAEKVFEQAMSTIEKKYIQLTREQRKIGLEADTTFDGKRTRGYYSNPLTESEQLSNVCWEIKDLNKKVEREFNKVKATKGDAATALQEKRNEMITDITLGVFESTEARAFLDKIPTLDDFVKLDKVDAILELEAL